MEQYHDVNSVADALDLNTQTIYRWIRSGKLEAKKAGRVWRISENAIQKTLDETPGNLAQRVSRTIEANGDLTEVLEQYEAENGEDELLRLVKQAIREKVKGTIELELE